MLVRMLECWMQLLAVSPAAACSPTAVANRVQISPRLSTEAIRVQIRSTEAGRIQHFLPPSTVHPTPVPISGEVVSKVIKNRKNTVLVIATLDFKSSVIRPI
jgi:hypothetical protein